MSDNQLQVFISWSQEPSKQIATYVYELLKDILPDQNVHFFLSSEGINPGGRFIPILDAKLTDSCFGILILTNNNYAQEWLMYEAGAIAKGTNSKLVPILFTREKEKIESPLKSFQYTTFEQASFFELICEIKKSMHGEINDKQKAILKDTLNKEWNNFEQKVKQIIDDHPDGNITQITNDNIVHLLMDENIYDEILPRRDSHLKELINNLDNDNSKRIIIFGGISTILRRADSVEALIKWKIDNPDSKLFICHESSNATKGREKKFTPDFYGAHINTKAELHNRKVSELQEMKETLFKKLDEQFHNNLIFIEIDSPLSIYVTIQGNLMHLTPTLDKRSSKTFTFKLKGSIHNENVLEYLRIISGKSNNNKTLLSEIELVSGNLTP